MPNIQQPFRGLLTVAQVVLRHRRACHHVFFFETKCFLSKPHVVYEPMGYREAYVSWLFKTHSQMTLYFYMDYGATTMQNGEGKEREEAVAPLPY